MRYLKVRVILSLHRRLLAKSGGAAGIRDFGGLESAAAQPKAIFAGVELYPTLIEKASALAYSIVMNHPFVDGNKRTAHAAMETFFLRNGFEIQADVDEQEIVMLRLAAGEMKREDFNEWLASRTFLLSDNKS